ncbi:MAG: hypothetical protein KC503_05860 [Myxococcales bacterium]|nr:hypothetical protein [Myxococcales bacterium]
MIGRTAIIFAALLLLLSCKSDASPMGASKSTAPGTSAASGTGTGTGTDTPSGTGTGTGTGTTWAMPAVVGAERPTRVYAPRALREGRAGTRRYPLVLMLHGYGASGAGVARGLGYAALVERAPLLLLAPDGRFNRVRRRFWRADPLCCDFFDGGKGDDDARYLRSLLERVIATYPVDRRRIYAVGHSNGGNMAYRLACFASDLLAAVVSFAGSTHRAGCAPRRGALSVLQIHGDADPVVPYTPKRVGRPLGRVAALPGAVGALSMWGDLLGCKGTLGEPSTLALHITARSVASCAPRVDATLWTVRGGDHTARRLPRFAERTWRWLLAHPKP